MGLPQYEIEVNVLLHGPKTENAFLPCKYLSDNLRTVDYYLRLNAYLGDRNVRQGNLFTNFKLPKFICLNG